MPSFFSTKQLTEEQQQNWDISMDAYAKVLEENCQREFRDMTEKDKKKFMGSWKISHFTDEDVLKQLRATSMFGANPPGHEKSSLFSRLLNGQNPLRNPPPLSFSYPDYHVVESSSPIEITMLSANNVKSLINQKTEFIPYKHVVINQSGWKVVKVISDEVIHLTNARWEKEGFVWELKISEISALDSQIAIIPHHNPSLGKITTLEDLKKEILFQSKDYFYAIKLAQSKEEYEHYEKLMSEKYNQFGNVMASQKLEHGKVILQKRKDNGLSEYPTEEEINSYAEEKLTKRYFNEYFVKDGVLHKKAVMLKRIFPATLTEEHYIPIFND